MSIGKPQQPKKSGHRVRHDGWTVDRQMRSYVLARTRSITKAAAVAGMSRESADRLRKRREAALFAAQYGDRAMRPVRSVRPRTPIAGGEGHECVNLVMARSPGPWVRRPA